MRTNGFRTVEISDPRFERDGLRLVTVRSAALQRRADVSVFVPRDASRAANLPLVILLHGVYGSHWSWSGRAGAHLTAQRLIDAGAIPPMVLAMPSDGHWGDGSGYLPHSGADYERWIVEEVPRVAALAAPGMIGDESPRFLTGLSMGGYGALRLGARHPGRFQAVSAHSAITRLEQMADFVSEPVGAYAPEPSGLSVIAAIEGSGGVLPPLRFDCGLDDPLIEANRSLHRALEERGVPHRYEEFPGGHEWSYWEEHLGDTLRFFAGRGR